MVQSPNLLMPSLTASEPESNRATQLDRNEDIEAVAKSHRLVKMMHKHVLQQSTAIKTSENPYLA